MRISQRVLQPVFGAKLATIFGRSTASAIDNFYRAVQHHKGTRVYGVQLDFDNIPCTGNTTLENLYLAGKFCLLKTYMKHCPEPHSSENYTFWIRDNVKNQYLLFLNQLVFGCLESYFIFKVTIWFIQPPFTICN